MKPTAATTAAISVLKKSTCKKKVSQRGNAKDETPLLTMLVPTSMSQLTAVCLQAHQRPQIGTAQSNSRGGGPQLADEP